MVRQRYAAHFCHEFLVPRILGATNTTRPQQKTIRLMFVLACKSQGKQVVLAVKSQIKCLPTNEEYKFYFWLSTAADYVSVHNPDWFTPISTLQDFTTRITPGLLVQVDFHHRFTPRLLVHIACRPFTTDLNRGKI